MLDACTVMTRGGVVVWSRSFAAVQGNPINQLVHEVLIGEHQMSDKPKFVTGPYELQWCFENELNLVFVTVFQKVLRLTYIPDLLQALRKRFCALYGEQIRSQIFQGLPFDQPFLDILDTVESQDEKRRITRRVPAAKAGGRPTPDEPADLSRSSSATGTDTDPTTGPRLRKKKGAKAAEAKANSKKNPPKKERRVWDDSKVTADRMKEYDFSGGQANTDHLADAGQVDHLMDATSLGQRAADGSYAVQDLRQDTDSGEDDDDYEEAAAVVGTNRLVSLFKSWTGARALSEADLDPVMRQMKEHLVAKNVASDIADHICQSVGQSLLNLQVGAFQSVRSAVKRAMTTTLQRILTPNTPVDLLRDIEAARAQKRPYTVVFVGVNGVGKSTNLSKVCFWLLQNRYRVLIAACDTFRSGAVEQLRVHARNLKALSTDAVVDIYERGYGKDSAGIAKDAITYAQNHHYDVVLVDTAGRMQDNEPLMRALAKLVSVNQPDKVIFVGEALVGNEAVDQLTKFNRALKDFSGLAQPRHIDGIILTKFDTIDDKVGAALSMTYTTGQPILFVGTGQTYTDLKNMKVSHVVQSLMHD
ncbi:hypothetical protein IWQ60_005959 [Tieghemiomyces parasiticus]|uniref:SRP54-type proteins GTP-binding domain-containing protein n=1 Tax=Tieghemiomyces parasiticus TaxID=78921 RepID=A0A9W8DYF1_9FUNG|nr:hypothetical protein IWQ60_005959 [Tieghemiomyces parasiticus]